MSTEIYGLVLVGGESRRMGSDKALLSYDGKATQLGQGFTTEDSTTTTKEGGAPVIITGLNHVKE